MKKTVLTAVLFTSISWIGFGQSFINIDPGSGNGIRFWDDGVAPFEDDYKIHMGNAMWDSQYNYGPVQEWALKSNMANRIDYGWVWGSDAVKPIAALGVNGVLQIKSDFYTETGKIGVGTITPMYKLDVHGTSHFTDAMSIGTTKSPNGFLLSVGGKMRAEEVEVSLTTSWPDYVFADDYKLKPLKEIKNFIEEHKHLPGVPSAQEVSENGIDLGKMNAILLQKIEELTLHVIELEKKIEEK